ncbi:MAG: RNA polymerase sigma factor [candidate division WOR-3 bacterium]
MRCEFGELRDIDEAMLDNLKKAKEGDELALEELCREVYKWIYKYLYYRVESEADCEELMSEVVIKMVRALKQQRGNFFAWVYKIAANALIDYYRKGKYKLETSYEELPQELPADNNPKEILRIDRLKEAIAHLSKEQAQVITLKFIQEYDNDGIAQIMGKSTGAIKVLQYRALKSLREYFIKKEKIEH